MLRYMCPQNTQNIQKNLLLSTKYTKHTKDVFMVFLSTPTAQYRGRGGCRERRQSQPGGNTPLVLGKASGLTCQRACGHRASPGRPENL